VHGGSVLLVLRSGPQDRVAKDAPPPDPAYSQPFFLNRQ
jgi:hypothetical protein